MNTRTKFEVLLIWENFQADQKRVVSQRHFLTGNFISASTLVSMIWKLLSLLSSMGLTVIAILCDQKGSQMVCISSLGVTKEEPWFLTESGLKVYVMHDMP